MTLVIPPHASDERGYCLRCGIIDCECVLQQYQCPKCEHAPVIRMPTTGWHKCAKCGGEAMVRHPEMRWVLTKDSDQLR